MLYGRRRASLAVVLVLFWLVACSETSTPESARVESGFLMRAIQSCELPTSASVVAYIRVGRNRFIMTPADDGESASLTLDLTTGDRVTLEIEFSVNGQASVIATADSVVPAAGPLQFLESDFLLTDSNSNSIPDCRELALSGELTETEHGLFLNGNHSTIVAQFNAPETTRFSKGISISADGANLRSAVHAATGAHAICADNIRSDTPWYWILPDRFTKTRDTNALSTLYFDMRTTGGGINVRHPEVVLVDRDGNQFVHRAELIADADWASFQVAIPNDEDWQNYGVPGSVTGIYFNSMSSLNAGLYLRGDLVSDQSGGSCLANVEMTYWVNR